MFRSLTILVTVFALILGSLGLPVYTHACEMMDISEAIIASDCPVCNPKPSCPACAQKGSERKRIDDEPGMKFSAKPCCSDHQFIQQTDPTVLSKLPTVPSPMVIAFAVFSAATTSQVETVHHVGSWFQRPPPLASRARATYLFNSTFLI